MAKKRFRCLIFDLDDTLLDTYVYLTPLALSQAQKTMIDLGLNASTEQFLSEREKYLTSSPKNNFFEHIIETFGVRPGIPSTHENLLKIAREGIKVFEKRKLTHKDLHLVEGAENTLTYLKEKYVLYLVTSGDPITQFEKIKACNISSFFYQIFFVDTSQGQSKSDSFIEILEIEKCSADKMLCIGDRLDKEILQAKKLGFKTCHIRYGEHKNYLPGNIHEIPDFQIDHIKELISTCRL